MKLTKFSKAVSEKLDNSKLYNIEEAFNMLMNFKREAFTKFLYEKKSSIFFSEFSTIIFFLEKS